MNKWAYVPVESIKAPDENALATGPFGSSIGSKTFRSEGVPVIRGSNLSAETGVRLNDEGLVFIDEELAQKFKRSKVTHGDLIFTCWGTINQVGLIDKRASYERYIISNKQMKLTPDSQQVDSLFLYYWFSSPQGQHDIISGGIGSSVPGFNLGQLRKMLIPLPLLSEQRMIASILGTLDDKIDLNRRMNETLEAMARAIFKDWFVDFGPVRAKAEGRQPPGIAREIAEFFPDTLDDEDKPIGWHDLPLSSFVELIGGGTPKTSIPEYWNGDVPWFSVVDAPSSSDIFVINTEKCITDVGLKNSSARLLDEGITIITARGTVGKLALVGQPMAMNQSCYGVKGKLGYPSFFTYFLVKSVVQGLQSRTHGSVFDTITRATFETVKFNNPGKDLAKAFEHAVSPLMERVKANLKESDTLGQLRDMLIPKLMSGEIRLKDAEKAVEAVV